MDSVGKYTFFKLLFAALISLSTVLGENPPGCNGYYKDKKGNITSPGYPSVYPDEADCTYVIGVHTLSYIWITFHDVQLEIGSDYLYYGSGRSADMRNYEGKIGGNILPEKFRVVTDSGMWLKLVTDNGIRYRGFLLSWTVEDYCGGTFTDKNGTLSSPYFPGLYPSYIDCLYVIKLDTMSVIHITSNTFRTEENYDVLEYGIETTEGVVTLGSFSGRLGMLEEEVTAETVWLRFTTDYAVAYTGFTIAWDSEDLPSTTSTVSSTASKAPEPTLAVVDDPRNERQQQQNGDIVFRTIVGLVVGSVTILLVILSIMAGIACFKRDRKQPSSTFIPPIITIEPRDPPSGMSMDKIPCDAFNVRNKTVVAPDLRKSVNFEEHVVVVESSTEHLVASVKPRRQDEQRGQRKATEGQDEDRDNDKEDTGVPQNQQEEQREDLRKEITPRFKPPSQDEVQSSEAITDGQGSGGDTDKEETGHFESQSQLEVTCGETATGVQGTGGDDDKGDAGFESQCQGKEHCDEIATERQVTENSKEGTYGELQGQVKKQSYDMATDIQGAGGESDKENIGFELQRQKKEQCDETGTARQYTEEDMGKGCTDFQPPSQLEEPGGQGAEGDIVKGDTDFSTERQLEETGGDIVTDRDEVSEEDIDKEGTGVESRSKKDDRIYINDRDDSDNVDTNAQSNANNNSNSYEEASQSRADEMEEDYAERDTKTTRGEDGGEDQTRYRVKTWLLLDM